MDRAGFRFLDQALSWDGKSTFTLDRMVVLLEALGNPQDKVRSIHVTGSNGKGSVCALISAMLQSAGFKVGQASSPHLHSPCERCIINGLPVSDEVFDAALISIQNASTRIGLSPSSFEITTAAAFLVFAEQNLDWMVVEVGLGGRLDATNTMKSPEVCAITSISLEHTEILGSSLVEIAREKTGIFRNGVPVVCSLLPNDALCEIKRVASALASPLYVINENFSLGVDAIYRGNPKCFEVPIQKCALQGEYQRNNIAVACQIAEILQIEPTSIIDGIRRVRWPGRLEYIPSWFVTSSTSVDVLLDAAHNPEGMAALERYFELSLPLKQWDEIVFIFSALTRKQWQQMLDILSATRARAEKQGIRTRLLLTRSTHPHAVPELTLQGYGVVDATPMKLCDVVEELRAEKPGRRLAVVAGSIFLLADLRPYFASQPFATYVVDDKISTGINLN